MIKAIQILVSRDNFWDGKIIYAHAHLEVSMFENGKLLPFAHPICLEGNNFWGIKKSSIWSNIIINPLDKQPYCRFTDPVEAVGFYDKFIKRGYPDSYKNRNDVKLYAPLLRQGRYGAFCPVKEYDAEFLARYNSLPKWQELMELIK